MTGGIPQPRRGHTTTAFSLSPGLTEVTMFGGSPELSSGKDVTQPKLAETTILQFSEYSRNVEHLYMYKETNVGRE